MAKRRRHYEFSNEENGRATSSPSESLENSRNRRVDPSISASVSDFLKKRDSIAGVRMESISYI